MGGGGGGEGTEGQDRSSQSRVQSPGSEVGAPAVGAALGKQLPVNYGTSSHQGVVGGRWLQRRPNNVPFQQTGPYFPEDRNVTFYHSWLINGSVAEPGPSLWTGPPRRVLLQLSGPPSQGEAEGCPLPISDLGWPSRHRGHSREGNIRALGWGRMKLAQTPPDFCPRGWAQRARSDGERGREGKEMAGEERAGCSAAVSRGWGRKA